MGQPQRGANLEYKANRRRLKVFASLQPLRGPHSFAFFAKGWGLRPQTKPMSSLFPQPSTKRFLRTVTNNLYREFQEAQTEGCDKAPPVCFSSPAKSATENR